MTQLLKCSACGQIERDTQGKVIAGARPGVVCCYDPFGEIGRFEPFDYSEALPILKARRRRWLITGTAMWLASAILELGYAIAGVKDSKPVNGYYPEHVSARKSVMLSYEKKLCFANARKCKELLSGSTPKSERTQAEVSA